MVETTLETAELEMIIKREEANMASVDATNAMEKRHAASKAAEDEGCEAVVDTWRQSLG